MNVTQFYTIVTDSIIDLLLIIHFVICVIQFLQSWSTLLLQYVLYSFLINWHRFLRPWIRAQISLQLLYLIVNILCNSFRVFTVKEAGTCTGTLSLINLILIYFNVHLSFLNDLLEISLLVYCFVYKFTEIMFIMLNLFHVIVSVTGNLSFNYNVFRQLFRLIVSFLHNLMRLSQLI